MSITLGDIARLLNQPVPPDASRIIQGVAALADAGQPKPFADLRSACRVRAATLYERLAAMAGDGRIVKSADGYRLAG